LAASSNVFRSANCSTLGDSPKLLLTVPVGRDSETTEAALD
jgi:hypothetical protein